MKDGQTEILVSNIGLDPRPIQAAMLSSCDVRVLVSLSVCPSVCVIVSIPWNIYIFKYFIWTSGRSLDATCQIWTYNFQVLCMV